METMPAGTVMFAAGGTSITAGRIRQTATNVAAQLNGAKRVYLYTASASLFVAGLLAASRKGLTVGCPAHAQPHYLREIGAEDGVLLTDETAGFVSKVPLTLASHEAEKPEPAQARDLELVFYTSGVTGKPKHVVKAIAQIDREAWALEQLWGKRAGRTYATVSHQHIYGMLFRVFWPVLSGRISEDRPAEYWESLAGKLTSGTTLISSPAHLTRLPPLAGSSPGLVFSSGAPLPFAAAQAARARFESLPIEVLGSTETGGIAWRQQHDADALWTPFSEAHVEIAEDGALRVASPYTGSDRPVATGDVAERVAEKFRLKSRADRIAKIDGKRVSLARVEDALLDDPRVAAAAAIDLPQRKGALGAIVELNALGAAALAQDGEFRLSRNFRRALADRLEPSERPKHWRFGEIPLNSQGKRVQDALRACFDAPDDATPGIVTAQDGDEAEIAITLSPDLIWFRGHFPDQPVLPGIAQVHIAVQWAEKLWAWSPAGANLTRLKFRKILKPNESVRLSLARDVAKQTLRFAFQLRDLVVSEGTIGGGE